MFLIIGLTKNRTFVLLLNINHEPNVNSWKFRHKNIHANVCKGINVILFDDFASESEIDTKFFFHFVTSISASSLGYKCFYISLNLALLRPVEKPLFMTKKKINISQKFNGYTCWVKNLILAHNWFFCSQHCFFASKL